MKRQCLILAATFILAGSGVSWSAEISGCVTRADGGLITQAGINLLDADYNYLGHLGNVDPETGCYSFSQIGGVDIAVGEYVLDAAPHPGPSVDQYYINGREQVTVIEPSTEVNFNLARGGNIYGVFTVQESLNNPDNNPLIIELFDQNGDWVTWGFVDTGNPVSPNAFPFTSQSVPPGSYYVKFWDFEDQYQSQWYSNVPDINWNWSEGQLVSVSLGATTPNINASLYARSEAANRYWWEYPYLETRHVHQSAANTTSTSVMIGSSIVRVSNSSNITSKDFASFTVTTPSGTCTDSTFNTAPLWRLMAHDQGDDGGPGDGIIDREDEIIGFRPLLFSEGFCVYGDSPHEAGTYQLSMTFLNGGNGDMPLTKSIDVPAGLSLAQLPTPTNLVAVWDDVTNQLQLDWAMPVYDPQYTRYVHVRINPYNKGQYLQNQVRVVNLPATIDTFTLSADLTVPFSHSGVDQLLIEVRVFGINNTMSTLSQSYNFSATTGGGLVPAAIAPPPYDINGDGQTGLAESIGILRDLAGP